MGCILSGRGSAITAATREAVRDKLLDPAVLTEAIPGAHAVERLADDRFGARLGFGVGPFHGVYDVVLTFAAIDDPFHFAVTGSSAGRLGGGHANGRIRLSVARARTRIEWGYEGDITGPVALAGRMLSGIAARVFCDRFFERLVRFSEGRP